MGWGTAFEKPDFLILRSVTQMGFVLPRRMEKDPMGFFISEETPLFQKKVLWISSFLRSKSLSQSQFILNTDGETRL